MKLIVNIWGNSEKSKIKAAQKIFPDHIRRSVKYGVRSEYSVIYDQFINERHYFLDIKKLFNIMKKNFTLHSSWPYNLIPREILPIITRLMKICMKIIFFFNLLVNEKL